MNIVFSTKFDDKEMEYIHFGKVGGEKLVILPGLALESVMGFAEAIVNAYSILAEDFDIYLFDHIKEEPKGYSIKDMADDTLKAFGNVGIDKAHVMGVSMGGMVAQELALKDRSKVLSLILCSTAGKVKGTDMKAFNEWERLAEEGDAKELSKAFGRYVYTPDFYEQYKEIIDASGDGAGSLDFSNFLISIKAIKEFDALEEIKALDLPAFVMAAGEDRVLGSNAGLELKDALKCRYYVYEGKGHGVYDEAPDYLQRIKDHLKDF